jgi:N-acetylmuramoyl-L-alanine amidase
LKKTIRAAALIISLAAFLTACGLNMAREGSPPSGSAPPSAAPPAPGAGAPEVAPFEAPPETEGQAEPLPSETPPAEEEQSGPAPSEALPAAEEQAEPTPPEAPPAEAEQAELASPVTPSATPGATPPAEKVLAGVKIGVDAGHQGKGNSAQEPVAPGSNETKAKVTSGTQGRVTGVAEHTVNLNVALLLEQKLLDLGAEVIMVRRTEDVDISNVERATMMNEAGADLVVRIHADGSENTSVKGASMLVPSAPGTDGINGESQEAGAIILEEFISVTGAKSLGVVKRQDLSGFNWSTVPAVLIELGYMTNEEEDKLLVTPEYQKLCAEGLARGVVKWRQSRDGGLS